MAWHEALSARRQWDRERDTPRVRQAFVTLAATRRQWPAPTDFIEALPPAKQLRALPASPADPERAKAALAECTSLLRGRA